MTRIAKISWAVLWFLIITGSPGWGVEVGEPAPDFTLQTFDGNNLSRSFLKGKPLMVIFWNTWCADCKRELPKINRLALRLAPGDVRILAVNTGLNDSEKKARNYWREHGYAFPAAFDRHFKIGTAFRVRGVPTILLVDTKGIVRYKSPLLPDDVEERIKSLRN